ncbi:DUF3017 domain-containing protein [Nocardioides sp. BP30]|uniref:DUF3017 domain-containing protein n=1 Tax=Nocardioides sp. BP30 TaxID=3036374 RepID=UPI002469684A|nr:DUF3017 domain-containing protein [Nocardioides sp. BP30]WGL51735.1 DUF3017 domain-containing protein [Nocardioides sp. BP30]
MTPLSDGPAHEPRPAVPDAPAPRGAADPAGPEAPEATQAPVPPPIAIVAEERRYPSTIGGLFYLGILALTVLALVVAGLGHWRGGVHILAVAMVAASVLRAVLRRRDTGMLAVRSRWFDVSLLGAVGIALWVLASTIPAQG